MHASAEYSSQEHGSKPRQPSRGGRKGPSDPRACAPSVAFSSCCPGTLIPKETKDMLLKDKVAVITGGAGLNGLGFATARLMASHGAHVVVLDLARAEPTAAAAQLGAGHL